MSFYKEISERVTQAAGRYSPSRKQLRSSYMKYYAPSSGLSSGGGVILPGSEKYKYVELSDHPGREASSSFWPPGPQLPPHRSTHPKQATETPSTHPPTPRLFPNRAEEETPCRMHEWKEIANV